jgi:hypothetical protein
MRPSMLICAAVVTAAVCATANAQSNSVQPSRPPDVSEPQTTGQVPRAPVGHRQPTAKDVPSEQGSGVKSSEVEELDRKLRICRGC